MNDCIKELAKQSGIWFEDTKEIRTHSVSTTTLERFAESIVQECIDYCGENLSKTVGGALKIHFGVEE